MGGNNYFYFRKVPPVRRLKFHDFEKGHFDLLTGGTPFTESNLLTVGTFFRMKNKIICPQQTELLLLSKKLVQPILSSDTVKGR